MTSRSLRAPEESCCSCASVSSAPSISARELATKFHQIRRSPSRFRAAEEHAPLAAVTASTRPVSLSGSTASDGGTGVSPDDELSDRWRTRRAASCSGGVRGSRPAPSRRQRKAWARTSESAPALEGRFREEPHHDAGRTRLPASAASRQVSERRLRLLPITRQRDPGLEPVQAVALSAPSGACARNGTIPPPAVIQLTSPGSMRWTVPRLSRCIIAPSKR